MSDTSGDSSVGADFCAVDTIQLDRNGTHSEDQEVSRTDSSSVSGSKPESELPNSEDSGTALVESTPMSKRLGFVEIFEMKTKLDHLHAWLTELKAEFTDAHGSCHKTALRHHKRTVDSMRDCLHDAAPMAITVSQYFDASVKKAIITKVDKIIAKMLRSEGAGSIAMKKLLAQTDFKTKLLHDIEQEVLSADDFPHEEPRLLLSAISEVVDYHLGYALLKQAQRQTEADLLEKLDADQKDLLEKFKADNKKAVQGVEDELRSAGLRIR